MSSKGGWKDTAIFFAAMAAVATTLTWLEHRFLFSLSVWALALLWSTIFIGLTTLILLLVPKRLPETTTFSKGGDSPVRGQACAFVFASILVDREGQLGGAIKKWIDRYPGSRFAAEIKVTQFRKDREYSVEFAMYCESGDEMMQLNNEFVATLRSSGINYQP